MRYSKPAFVQIALYMRYNAGQTYEFTSFGTLGLCTGHSRLSHRYPDMMSNTVIAVIVSYKLISGTQDKRRVHRSYVALLSLHGLSPALCEEHAMPSHIVRERERESSGGESHTHTHCAQPLHDSLTHWQCTAVQCTALALYLSTHSTLIYILFF